MFGMVRRIGSTKNRLNLVVLNHFLQAGVGLFTMECLTETILLSSHLFVRYFWLRLSRAGFNPCSIRGLSNYVNEAVALYKLWYFQCFAVVHGGLVSYDA